MLQLIARLGLSSMVWGAIELLSAAQAQIIRDTTLPTNSEVLTTGNDATIRGGTQVGGNLFHSFERFSVPTNGSAFFDNASTVQNIISRVTGALPSSIDGTIRANGTANLFLINPNGILFGENARLNIGGSFVASTANAIRFGETGLFSASDPAPRPLLNVNPSALLFTTLQRPAGIVSRSRADNLGLQVPVGKSLVLAGGDVHVDGGLLYAPGGRLELGGLSGTGILSLKVDSNNLSLIFPNGVERGDVSLLNKAFGFVANESGGDIAVHSRNLTLSSGSALVTGIFLGRGRRDSQAGNIVINATNEVLLERSAVFNQVWESAIGNGGNIQISASSLKMLQSTLFALSEGQGRAGNIIINTQDTIFFDQSNALSNLFGEGQGGDVRIQTGSIRLINGSGLDASTFGKGNAGNIIIDANRAVLFEGVNPNIAELASGAFSAVEEGGVGQGGDVRINASSLTLTNGAKISTNTEGIGNAGNAIVYARDLVSLDGSSPDGQLSSGIVSRVSRNAIGQAGDIRIVTGKLLLTNEAQIDNTTSGKGKGGNVTIQARDLLMLSNFSLISTSTFGDSEAGNVQILETGTVNVQSNAAISVGSLGNGRSGDIQVQANILSLDRGVISADTLGVDGGNIDLNLNALVMRNNGQISTSVGNVDAGGNGGNIILNSGAILALPRANADISANAFRGNGGKIEINTQGIFGFSIDSQPTIETNDITASSQFGISGTVTLNTPDVDPSRGTIELPATVLDRSNQISQTCAPQKAIASSFVRSGRGSLPPSPLDTLQGEPNSPELATVGSNSENYSDRISSLPNASSIIEAQGWVKDAQGKVTLVANSNTATTYPQTLGSCH